MARNGGQRKRVDYQVSIMVAVLVVLSFGCVFAFTYSVTYNSMLDTLEKQADSIYAYCEGKIDKASFETIEIKDDSSSDVYLTAKRQLETVREATGVRYLYTAARASDGELIYVVDGLPDDSSDFRYPGDAIESEIVPELERALSGELVYPSDIKDTGWGYVFVSYYPIHDGDKVVGAIGIEFSADKQYEAFRTVRIGTPLIGIVFCIGAIAVARILFRRISNPTFKDMANTDYLTSFKNRNAFDIDIANREHDSSVEGVVVIDLDRLKMVNDRLGHSMGDDYIKAAARVMHQAFGPSDLIYRVGGDEFTVLCSDLDETRAAHIMSTLEKARQTTVVGHDTHLMFSVSFATRRPGEPLEEVLRRADISMYEMKREHHERYARPS